ncbi:DUF302 domain-containing protein [Patescibacteria group bacterium]|nr:DUF302 domain-containing protein [Patescibacteria group bacterium]
MSNVTSTKYANQIRLDIPYEEAVNRVVAALKEQGFGVLTEVDVQATLKKKLDADFRRYLILGACNPPLAYQALQTDIDVGLLLPCNVVVYEDDNASVVAILDPIIVIGMADNSDLHPIAVEARQKLDRVLVELT